MNMKKLIVTLLSMMLLSTFMFSFSDSAEAIQGCNSLGFSSTSQHVLFGRPLLRVAEQPTTNNLVIRNIYELNNNGVTKFANWVGYFLDGSTFGSMRDAEYATDGCLNPDLTLEATPDDENDFDLANAAGYELIPLAPNATFAASPHWSDTQLYSNIVPMHRDLVDAWHQLERDIEDFVSRGNDAYVLTGPVYRADVPRLPRANEDHTVPSGYWKIVYVFVDPEEDEDDEEELPNRISYTAYLLDQSGCLSQSESDRVTCNSINQNYTRSPIRIVDIEGFTRWDFFSEMDNSAEFEIERVNGLLDLIEEED